MKSSSYIVNKMDTTLLLVVLFERTVAVEFSIKTKTGWKPFREKYIIFHINALVSN